MRHTVVGSTMATATIALDMAIKAQADCQQQLAFSKRYVMLALKELEVVKAQVAQIIAEEGPEPFQKIGDRYVLERDLQAAIKSGIETATQELVAKLAALDAPKKGKA